MGGRDATASDGRIIADGSDKNYYASQRFRNIVQEPLSLQVHINFLNSNFPALIFGAMPKAEECGSRWGEIIGFTEEDEI